MSLQALSDYTIFSRYGRYDKEKKRREIWSEMTDRVFEMHSEQYTEALKNPEFEKEFNFAKEMVKKKRVLGAQRILQFGGAPIFKHNAKVFNCSYGYIDRVQAFNEAMYLLLCGCGVGFSVQTKHVAKLPNIQKREKGVKTFIAEDSIEGWSDCIAAVMSSYFIGGVFPEYEGYTVEFDFSKIRPEGSLIADQFKAPGSNGLNNSLKKIEEIMEDRITDGHNTLRPIDVYDIIMHLSDAVLSGGVRRSATICLFSKEDQEMMTAKTGDWYIKNPQRGRSNNSVLLIKDKVTKPEFDKIMESTRAFGEPGFVFSDSEDIGYNPCLDGDTIVSTNIGNVKLKDICSSPEEYKVLSYDIENNKTEYMSVLNGIKTRENADVIKIEFEDGSFLEATPDHKVYTKNRGYVKASELSDSDELISIDFDKDLYESTNESTIRSYINQSNWKNVVIPSF